MKIKNRWIKRRYLAWSTAIFFVVFAISTMPGIVQAQDDFQLYAKSAVLMDADSGRVLWGKDETVHMPNASTTKILTCILVLEQGNLQEEAVASSYAASMPKVRLGMEEGDRFYVKDLLYSLMLESHNDSAVVLAEYIAGSVETFAERMNEKARELGCQDTYFITPNGLDAQNETGIHGTTAQDLALIMSYCLQNEEFLEITGTGSYSFTNIQGNKSYSCTNHNAFLSMMDGALTGKTGFTGNAGYCYVGALRQGDRTFVVALLACGWPNNKSYKWSDTRKLMEYALEQYQYQEVFDETWEPQPIPVEEAVPRDDILGEEVFVIPCLKKESLRVLKAQWEEIHVVYDLPQSLTAPIKEGTIIGSAIYYLEEQELARYPITIEETLAGLDGKWYACYVLRNFFSGAALK